MKQLRSLRLAAVPLAWAALAAIAAAPASAQPAGDPLALQSERGDRLPDYSAVGYRAGTVPLPDVPAKVTLSPVPGDNHAQIQAAIQKVEKMKPDADGFRGAVVLGPGRYEVGDTLRVQRGGVVIRGAGQDPETGTVVVATKREQHVLFMLRGRGGRGNWKERPGTRVEITDPYVPVSEHTVTVADASSLAVGEEVLLVRPGTPAWLERIGMDDLSTEGAPDPDGVRRGKDWTPEETTLRYHRTVTAIDGDRVTLDAPVVLALDAELGGGYLTKYDAPGEIRDVGIEHLRLESVYDPSVTRVLERTGETYLADEDHARTAVMFHKIRDGWARNVTAAHFTVNAVLVTELASYVTVQDCASLAPVSIITGRRRYAFALGGQRTLFNRCYSEGGRHDFVLVRWACGPSVFFDCHATNSYSYLEPHGQMNTGILYDNVSASGPPHSVIATLNRGTSGRNHGWTAAGLTWWNCDAAGFVVMSPPGSNNFLVGELGTVPPAPERTRWVADWATYRNAGDPIEILRRMPYIAVGPGTLTASLGRLAEPRSLFLHQLGERAGAEAVERATTADQRERLERRPRPARRPASASADPPPAAPPVAGDPSLRPILLGSLAEGHRVGEPLAVDAFDSPASLEDWAVQVQPRGDRVPAELPDARVEVRDGELHAFLPGVGATIWRRGVFEGPVVVAYRVRIPEENLNGGWVAARDVNTFALASDPSGSPEALLSDPAYDGNFLSYHGMRGYYASTGGGQNTTTRARVYPREVDGEEVDHVALTDRDGDPGFLLTPGATYTVQLAVAGDRFQYAVNGQVVYDHTAGPGEPVHDRGLVGLRGVKTHHAYDAFGVWRLEPRGGL